jgi:hypothetical protein
MSGMIEAAGPASKVIALEHVFAGTTFQRLEACELRIAP